MEALATRLLERLERPPPDPETLAETLELAGDPEPRAAAEAFLAAAADADLTGCRELWVPELLTAARPGFGAQRLLELARALREAGERLSLAEAPVVPRLLGCSNFLARRLVRRPGEVAALRGALPERPTPEPIAPDWDAIRRAKYAALLRVAARDLQQAPLPDSLEDLSQLADGCLAAGLTRAAEETGAPAPAIFALGKLGGRELNFSSDVDLLFLSDPPRSAQAGEHNRQVERLVRALKTNLEAPTDEGFAYRVDLDLRPEGKAGVLLNSLDAALSYYETYGAEWERQMLIRLRPVAGPAETLRGFAESIAPFVYRRSIDPSVMDAVRDMKARIESERRHAGRDLEADLKEGPGGIRDIEFLVQSLQLFHGARHPTLRTGNVLDALGELGRAGLLPEPATASLTRCYTWLRRAEHAVQLVEEQRTAAFPRERFAQLALARRLGYRDPLGEAARNRLLDDWTSVRGEARAHFEALVLRGGS